MNKVTYIYILLLNVVVSQDIIYHTSFEEDGIWSTDSEWIRTDAEFHSGNWSVQEIVNDSLKHATLYSPEIQVPEILDDDQLFFKFWTYGNAPCAVYEPMVMHGYRFRSREIENTGWSQIQYAGMNYWTINYIYDTNMEDGAPRYAINYLDTPSRLITGNGTIYAHIMYTDDNNFNDKMDFNVRISNDNGLTWSLIGYEYSNSNNAWTAHDKRYAQGNSWEHLNFSTDGDIDEYLQIELPDSVYNNNEIKLRFGFAIDAGSNNIDSELTIGDILIIDELGIQYNSSNLTTPPLLSGKVWNTHLYDYFDCGDARPGSCGQWEEFSDGDNYNGSLDISYYSGKNIQFMIQSFMNNDEDFECDYYEDEMFFDDFTIYNNCAIVDCHGNCYGPSLTDGCNGECYCPQNIIDEYGPGICVDTNFDNVPDTCEGGYYDGSQDCDLCLQNGWGAEEFPCGYWGQCESIINPELDDEEQSQLDEYCADFDVLNQTDLNECISHPYCILNEMPNQNSVPEGDCDCDGNVFDECGECGGDGPGVNCDCDGNLLDDNTYCDCDGNVFDECGECGGENDCLGLEGLPTIFTLNQPYPNPFNPVTIINYDIPKISYVKMSIYNTNGQLVEKLTDKLHEPGSYNLIWNAQGYTSGVYFVKLIAEDFVATQKIMLIK